MSTLSIFKSTEQKFVGGLLGLFRQSLPAAGLQPEEPCNNFTIAATDLLDSGDAKN